MVSVGGAVARSIGHEGRAFMMELMLLQQRIRWLSASQGVGSLVPFSSVQSFSHVQLCDPMNCSMQASLSITNSWSLPKPKSIESVMPSNHLILCHPLLLLPSIPPSIRVFSNESALRIRWPKYWGFSFNISPSNEHPGLISFRMDWFDLFAVQGTLKHLLQHHSSKVGSHQTLNLSAPSSWTLKPAEM